MTLIRVYYENIEQEIDIAELELHPEMLVRLRDLGIIEFSEGKILPLELKRAHQVLRLRSSLGVNLTGAAIILELLNRIYELQDKIEELTGGDKDGH